MIYKSNLDLKYTIIAIVLFCAGIQSCGSDRNNGYSIELKQLYMADQAERSGGKVIYLNDIDRLNRVKEIESKGGLISAEDFYHAAMFYQHGGSSEDYLKAFQHSKRALEIKSNLNSAKWLKCAAEDRYLQSIGKPQVWGTQFKSLDNKVWTLEPFDPYSKTLEQRNECLLPTLEETFQMLDDLNKNSNVVN